jgi:hypothetical protein
MPTQILDCVVNYFGLDENNQPGLRRYFCYHILAGPGPTAGSGVATVLTLAIHDETERCTSCKHLHAVEAGGPPAAMAAAIHYLDAYHELDHVIKVESEVRGLHDGRRQTATLTPMLPRSAFQGRGDPVRQL